MSLGERIRELRTARGWSLSKLAEEAGVAKGYVSVVENDPEARPSMDTVMRLARALELPMSELTGTVSEPERPTDPTWPESLRRFAQEHREVSDEDLQMLARIKFRGHQPATVQDWWYLYDTIRRTVGR